MEHLLRIYSLLESSLVAQCKEATCNAGDAGNSSLSPGLGRSLEGSNGYPLQYSFLKNPMDRGAWWATVIELQRVTQDWTEVIEHTHMHSLPCPATDVSKKAVVPAF